MNEIERRARDLIAAEIFSAEPRDEYLADYYLTNPLAANTTIYKMIIRALTPPEGYVLVPLERTEKMSDAGCMALAGSIGGYESGCVSKCYRAMVAARPEIPND